MDDDWKQSDIQEFMDKWGGEHIINSDMVFSGYPKKQEIELA